MLNLQKLQMDFQQYLLTENNLIEKEILSTINLSAKNRLDIYRDAYYLRLLEALELDFEMLHTILGDEQFDVLGRQYIDAHPSTFRSIGIYGKNFPKFIEENIPHPLKNFFYELATFEWLLAESFVAANDNLINLEEMALIPPEQWPTLCFTLHPSSRMLETHWNILQIWNGIQNSGSMISPQKLDKKIHILIWRKALDIQFCSLPEDKKLMLDLIVRNHSFASICEELCALHDENEVGMIAAQLLKECILDGIITRISI